MPSRTTNEFEPQLPEIWSREGALWRAHRAALERAIVESGTTQDHHRRRMGHGYRHLARAQAGELLTKYEVQMVEWGLTLEVEAGPGHRSP